MKTTIGNLKRVIRESIEGDDAIMVVANAMDQLRGGSAEQEQEIIHTAVGRLNDLYPEPWASSQLPDVMGATEIDDIADLLVRVSEERRNYETDPASADLDQLAQDEKELPVLAADLMGPK